jgi:hypothetical protein
MKSLIKTAAAFSVLAFAQQASADLTVNITGSTAFRGIINSVVPNLFTGGAAACKRSHNETAAKGIGSATKAIFQGSHPTYGTLTVRVTWTGSVFGIKDVSQQNNIDFLTLATLTGANGVIVDSATATETGKAQMCLSDVYQASTSYTAIGLTDVKVAVQPFRWVASKSATIAGAGNGATWGNVTAQQIRALYTAGNRNLGMFTGVASDVVQVYASGRDPGSGTRLTALAETKYGAFTSVNQWKPTVSSGAVTTLQYWPAETVDGIPLQVGNSGFTSGGTLATALGATSLTVQTLDEEGGEIASSESLLLLGYVGRSDANAAITLGARLLTYEGVADTDVNIQQGSYSFWCYEHLLSKTGLTTDEGTFKTALTTQITSNLGSNNVSLTSMGTVARTTDGGLVTY